MHLLKDVHNTVACLSNNCHIVSRYLRRLQIWGYIVSRTVIRIYNLLRGVTQSELLHI